MLTLTSPIAVPNVNRIRVDSVQLDSNTSTAIITCSVFGVGAPTYKVLQIAVRDGSSDGIRAKSSPTGYSDIVEIFAVSTPTGFTTLVAAYTGGIVARNKAAETAIQTLGLLPAGVVA